MAVPSIKGSAFQSAPADVNRLVEEGRITREHLELRLTPEDLATLEEKINPARWYPIDGYERMAELLAEIEAPERREAYLMERGANAAERLAAAGIYEQLHAKAEQWGPRVGRIIMSIQGAIYNFTHWEFESLESPRFLVSVTDASAFPDAARWATQGFIRWIADRTQDVPMHVTSERPTPDRILFRGDLVG